MFRIAVPCSLTALLLVATVHSASAQLQIDAEAYRGTPYSVGRVTLRSGGEFRINGIPRPGGGRLAELAKRIAQRAGAKGNTTDLSSAELALTEANARVLYPVFAKRERPILKEFINVPSERTVYFLFAGDAPLEVTFYSPEPTAGKWPSRQDM